MVGLAVVVGGGFVFNKWAQEAQLRGIIDDVEAGTAALEPFYQLLLSDPTNDPELAHVTAILGESIDEAKKARDFAKNKDLVSARHHYESSVAKLYLFDSLFRVWVLANQSPRWQSGRFYLY